jgi:guanylate kinase
LADVNLDVPPRAEEAFAAVSRYLAPEPQLVVISGPSGVGKDSVLRRMRELGYPFYFVVTATDRPPRAGEVEGGDYHFVTTAELERLIAEDELFEYARVYEQYKGVPKGHVREALAAGTDVIMRLDVQGAATISRLVPEALSIFIAPPSLEVLVERLRQRGGDSEAQLQRRIATAIHEMGCLQEFQYVVVNRQDDLDRAVHEIAAIITAARCCTAHRQVVV